MDKYSIKYLAIFILLYLSGCQEVDYYFDFDSIIHYKNDISTEEVIKLLEAEENNLQNSLLFEAYPKNVIVPTIEKYLTTSGFIIQDIKAEKIKSCFEIYEKQEFYDDKLCTPIYRDIFLFKRSNAITGIAKICFECNQKYFLGEKKDSYSFWNDREFELLKQKIK